MRRAHTRRTALLAVLALAAALVLTTIALAACGDDPYSGTWKASVMGESMTLKIEKDGDKWVVTNADEADGETIEGTEEDGALVLKDPDNPDQVMKLKREDDKLIMEFGGMNVEFTKQ